MGGQPSYSDFVATGWETYGLVVGTLLLVTVILGYFDVFNYGWEASLILFFLLGLAASNLFYRGTRDWAVVLAAALPIVYALQWFLPTNFKTSAALFLLGFAAARVGEEWDVLHWESRY